VLSFACVALGASLRAGGITTAHTTTSRALKTLDDCGGGPCGGGPGYDESGSSQVRWAVVWRSCSACW